jgi:hypothetical protein
MACVEEYIPVGPFIDPAAIASCFGREVLYFGPDDGIEYSEPDDTSKCHGDDVSDDSADLFVG